MAHMILSALPSIFWRVEVDTGVYTVASPGPRRTARGADVDNDADAVLRLTAPGLALVIRSLGQSSL